MSLKNTKIIKLKLFPITNDYTKISEEVIEIDSIKLLMLISKWSKEKIKGKSYVFLYDDIKDFKEEELIKKLNKEYFENKIEKYKIKYKGEYAFLYFS